MYVQHLKGDNMSKKIQQVYPLLFTLSAIFLSACIPHSDPNPTQKVTETPEPAAISGDSEKCEDFIKKMPSNYYYGWISVPENYEKPEESPQIQVFYYGPKGDFKEHIVFFNGGPGSDSHYNYTLFDQSFTQMNIAKDKLGFVYIDQRGNGCSSPYPAVSNKNDILRLRFYGSSSIVRDAENVRKFLFGEQKWKIFGQSYGAFVVHRYVTLFPDSITTAYAHANAITLDPMDRMTERIYSQYTVMLMYLKQHPDDRKRLQLLYDFFKDKDKCFKNVQGIEFCGYEINKTLISNLGFFNQWNRLHDALKYLVPYEKNKTAKVSLEKIKQYISKLKLPLRPNNGHSYAMPVLALYDRNVIDLNFQSCTEIYNKILSKYKITPEKMILNECLPELQRQESPKKWLQVVDAFQTSGISFDHLHLDQFIFSLKKMNSDQFYLYSGEKDTFVPKAIFYNQVSMTSDLLTYRHFLNSGHEGFFTENTILEDLLR